MTDRSDRAYMEMALGLAAKAAGRTSPNPCVGAVLVKDGLIVGAGYHEAAGKPHAEAVALSRAGKKARGATLYVTLEPCVHWGRTPPCADALIAAGVKRVVAADLDPNPLVLGQGAELLREAGILVEIGLLAGRSARLNECYRHYAAGRGPFVTVKAAVSLDGKMATRERDSRWITSEEAREYAHLLRAEHDAVLVGIETALCDNPRLTVRHPLWPGRRGTRAVLDRTLRLPPSARLLEDSSGGPVIVFCGPGAPASKRAALEKVGAEIVPVPVQDGRLDIDEALVQLGKRNLTGVLVEGGGRVATAFLTGPRADKAVLVIAPLIIGGAEAVSFYGGAGFARLAHALRLREVSAFRVADDLIVEGYL